MNALLPFGFVTGCHAGDKALVGATLASIRHYLPDVPICLVQDGDFDISDLVACYQPIILRPQELLNQTMRDLTSGSFRAKLTAMWEGPFERFVWLDSDAIVWGDFTEQIDDTVDFQIFWDGISIPPDAVKPPQWLDHFHFDLDALLRYDPDFEWRGLPYFCTGAFSSRRNAIPFDDWILAEKWLQESPNLFKFGEMGMMNYLVHALAQRGRLTISMTDLQDIWTHSGKAGLEADCRGVKWCFPISISRPRVAHFCGRKPNVLDCRAYSHPFTIARLNHHKRMGLSTISSWAAILKDDTEAYVQKARRRLSFSDNT